MITACPPPPAYIAPYIQSQIISASSLKDIEPFLDKADADTLVLWDVDQTLHSPDDAILKPQYEKRLDDLMGGKKVLIQQGKPRYLFREILMSASHSLVEPDSPSMIKKLQDRGIKAIAFTAAPGGKIGQVDSFLDWRIVELKKYGFDFSPAFSGEVVLPKDPDLEFPPVYKSGVLITSLHDKGQVISDFLDKLQWTPKKILFIDNERGNLESVVSALRGRVEVIGFHYTVASKPCPLNEEFAKTQVDHFIQTGLWLPDPK